MTGLKRRLLRTIIVLLCVMLPVCGCESLGKKFVRKKKKQEKSVPSMVLSPEAYPDSRANKEDSYRNYLMLWSGWQDELIDNLSDQSASQRRELDSIQEAINNLAEMRELLVPEKQIVADGYLESLKALKSAISKDIYGNNRQSAFNKAQDLKRQIYGALRYKNVKGSLQ